MGINGCQFMAFTRKARRIMLILLSILSACILIIVGVLFAYSPGKPMPFLDKNGIKLSNSISEKVFLDINGSKQGMFIKGKNLDNPVILFLHGGIPVYFLTKKYPTHLEDNFTMVWWEQRNSEYPITLILNQIQLLCSYLLMIQLC